MRYDILGSIDKVNRLKTTGMRYRRFGAQYFAAATFEIKQLTKKCSVVS
jgi:hypothetical protein